jgi:signal transduction histidine kinase
MKELKLLVVDDELGIREGVKRVLNDFSINLSYIGEVYDLKIAAADSGENAIELVEKEKFDLILLDNKLPGIQGTEVLEYLNKNNIDVLTLMITAYASIETAVMATKVGAYDFLVKPFTPDELKSAVHKAGKHLILTRLTRKLTEEKNKIRFQFLSVVAHELKSPIAAISGYLKLMKERAAGKNIEDYDRIIERSLVRIDGMNKLIFDLLDLTRIESGEKKRNLDYINVVNVVKSVVENHKSKALEKNIDIITIVSDKIMLKADAVEIEMILNNLLSNAIKYNKENGIVKVTIKNTEENVIFKIADTGIGMTQVEIQQLFSEFSRIKNEKTKHIIGSGLGLSIVKKLVILYNGHIKVDSIPDEGTVFTVILNKT